MSLTADPPFILGEVRARGVEEAAPADEHAARRHGRVGDLVRESLPARLPEVRAWHDQRGA